MITFAYKLYSNKRNRHLSLMLEEAMHTWNRALAIQKRYYSLYGKYVQCSRMKAHFARRSQRRLLTAASMQEILERQERSFLLFFKKKAKRPPKFKNSRNFRSVVFKSNIGYKLYGNEIVINSLNKKFKFFYSRPYSGNIKRVQILRGADGEYRIYITTDAETATYRKTHNGASVGMDFGLKTFLTLSNGETIKYPRFLEKDLQKIRKASVKRSKLGGEKTKCALAKKYERVKNQRDDWQWKLAHTLCRNFDNIFIEDLNLVAMGKTRRWGRKIYDYAFAEFIHKLNYVASKYEVSLQKVKRTYPSSKTCFECGAIFNGLSLTDRTWVCPECGALLDRDLNAAKNILRQGIVSSKNVLEQKLL